MPDSLQFVGDLDPEGSALFVGRELGHYRVIEKLGQGGMGVVYLADDLKLKRQVALKILPPGVSSDPERRARFRREAEALAAISHPNIVTVFSIEEVEGLHFLTMERVEGRSLDDLGSDGGMAVDRLIEIGIAVSEAIAAAHARGIIHRDLKPANLMMTSSGRIKVLDFGLAKPAQVLAQPLTTERAMVGTVPYMAPEQIRGGEVDARSDVFSMGAVLYELATGKRPFGGTSAGAVLAAIFETDPEPVQSLRPDIPRGLARVIEQCLQKEPSRRFQSFTEIIEALAPLRAPVSGRPTGSRRNGRRSWLWLSGLAAVLAIVGIVVWKRPGGTLAGNGPATGIVVMPFDNGGSPDDAYFVEAMTHGIASRLNTVHGLKVVSLRSVGKYSDKQPQQIGKELAVDYLLYAKVYLIERDGARRVGVTPELVRASDGDRFWRHPPYNRLLPAVEDVLTVQRDIAAQVIEQLGLGGEAEGLPAVGIPPTTNIEAYNHYLRGTYLWGKRSEPFFERAEESFRQAVALDPGFALAHLGLASMPNVRAWYCLVDPRVAQRLTVAAMAPAIQAGPDLPEVWAGVGLLREWERDLKAAEEAYLKSIRLAAGNPKGYPPAHHWYGGILDVQGRHDEALEQALIAQRLDPISPIITTWVGLRYYYAGRPAEAVAEMSKALFMDDEFLPAHWHRSWAQGAAGNGAGAVTDALRAQALWPANTVFTVNLAWARAISGDTEGARRLITEIENDSRTRYVSGYHLASVHAALGNHEAAFRCLESAVVGQDGWCIYLRIDPRLAALRGDARFDRLAAQIGL